MARRAVLAIVFVALVGAGSVGACASLVGIHDVTAEGEAGGPGPGDDGAGRGDGGGGAGADGSPDADAGCAVTETCGLTACRHTACGTDAATCLATYPAEICNGVDDNCNGLVDEGLAGCAKVADASAGKGCVSCAVSGTFYYKGGTSSDVQETTKYFEHENDLDCVTTEWCDTGPKWTRDMNGSPTCRDFCTSMGRRCVEACTSFGLCSPGTPNRGTNQSEVGQCQNQGSCTVPTGSYANNAWNVHCCCAP